MQKHVILGPAVMMALASSSLAGGPSFVGLDLPTSYDSRATALSPDGSVVMGEIWAPGMPRETFRWTAGGLSRQAVIPGWGGYAWPYAMSYDGSVVVGYDEHPAVGFGHAFTWTPAGGRVYVGDPVQVLQSEPWGVSWDGTSAVGYRVATEGVGDWTPEAVLWTNGASGVTLCDEPSYGSGISAGGEVVVGMTDAWPYKLFRWTPQGGTRFISLPDPMYLQYAPRVSADGSTIAGGWVGLGHMDEVFVWTEQTGAIGLGDLPGGDFESSLGGLSADGRIIVGTSVTGTFIPDVGLSDYYTTAFIWDAAHGMQRLPDVLTNQYGLDLQGWQLWEATGISADGGTIVGNGIGPDGHWGTWIVVLPEPCSAMLFLSCVVLAGHRFRSCYASES